MLQCSLLIDHLVAMVLQTQPRVLVQFCTVSWPVLRGFQKLSVSMEHITLYIKHIGPTGYHICTGDWFCWAFLA